MTHFKPTYEPEEWAHSKRVEGKDALALANALRLGLSRVHQEVIAAPILNVGFTTQEDFEQRNRSLLIRIPEFSEFLERGEFSFAWDD